MKILIVELDYRGHHIILYLNKLIGELLKKKHEVFLLTTKSTTNSEPFYILKDKYLNQLSVYVIEDIDLNNNKNLINKFYFQLKYFFLLLSQITKLNNEYRFSRVYFNHFDPFFFAFAIFGYFFRSCKVSGLLLNIKFHQYFFGIKKKNILDNIKLLLFKFFLKNLKLERVFIIDDLFKIFLKRKKIFSKKIVYINEAINKITFLKKNICKKKLLINKKGKCILIYGSITQRKGVLELLEAINLNILNGIYVIIAGKFEKKYFDEIKSFLDKNKILKKKIILLNKFISFNEENYLFNLCDYVWLGYNHLSSDGSSGVLKLSIMAKKPVIASDRGLIGFLVKKNKVGFLFSENNLFNLQKILRLISLYKSKRVFYKNLVIYRKKLLLNSFEKQISEVI